jgi:AcrR family transcriptional regulator
MSAQDERLVEGDTRLRLIQAAERLIGERGVAEVTVRDVTTEAGASSAAVHYHFETKEGLIRAVLDNRFAVTNLERLRTAESTMTFNSVSELATAIVRPAFAYRSAPESTNYLDFVAALLLHPDYVPMVVDYYADHLDAFVGRAQVLRPDLDLETIAHRLVFALFLVFFTAGSNTSPLNLWVIEIGHDPGNVEDHLVDAVAGILSAP